VVVAVERALNKPPRLETGFENAERLFRYVLESNKAIHNFPVPKLPTPSIELYRQGKGCLVIDLDFRPLGTANLVELSTVFYRFRLGKEMGGNITATNLHVDHADPEKRWNNEPMLVEDCEIVEGSQPIPVPVFVWLYPRFKYSDNIRGKLGGNGGFWFKSLTDGLLKAFSGRSSGEGNACVWQAGVPAEDAHSKVEAVPEIVNYISDKWPEFIMVKSAFTSGDPGNPTGLKVKVRDGLISVELNKTLQEIVQVRDMCLGPLQL